MDDQLHRGEIMKLAGDEVLASAAAPPSLQAAAGAL